MKMIPLPQAGDKVWEFGNIVGEIAIDENDPPSYIEEGDGRDDLETEAVWQVPIMVRKNGEDVREFDIAVRWNGAEWMIL